MSRNIIKNALITGGAKRLGREIAIALAKDGWNIALHHNNTSPDETVAELKALGSQAVPLKADLTNFTDAVSLVGKAAEQLGEITLLINNASIFDKASFLDSDESLFDANMDVHVKAPYFLAHKFAKQTQNGQIINICDTKVTKNTTAYFPYLLSKKALSALGDMLAVELSPYIRVNTILPGFTTYSEKNEYYEQRLKEIPLRYASTGDDISSAVVFLANSNLTGQKIFTDGGEQLI